MKWSRNFFFTPKEVFKCLLIRGQLRYESRRAQSAINSSTFYFISKKSDHINQQTKLCHKISIEITRRIQIM
jgi:hypothetical protein